MPKRKSKDYRGIRSVCECIIIQDSVNREVWKLDNDPPRMSPPRCLGPVNMLLDMETRTADLEMGEYPRLSKWVLNAITRVLLQEGGEKDE